MTRSKLLFFSLAVVLIVIALFLIDFEQPAWTLNSGPYLIIMAMLLLIMSLILGKQHQR